MNNEEDKQLIAEFGLEKFDQDLQQGLLAQYYETVNMRVAMKLEDELSDEQLAEFEKVHDAGDDEATQQWLKSTITDYDKLVNDETEAVKADIKQMIALLHASVKDRS